MERQVSPLLLFARPSYDYCCKHTVAHGAEEDLHAHVMSGCKSEINLKINLLAVHSPATWQRTGVSRRQAREDESRKGIAVMLLCIVQRLLFMVILNTQNAHWADKLSPSSSCCPRRRQSRPMSAGAAARVARPLSPPAAVHHRPALRQTAAAAAPAARRPSPGAAAAAR